MTQRDPDIRGFIGITGAGKSWQIKRAIEAEKPRRLLVWDIKGEYWRPGEYIVPRVPSLAAAAKSVGKADFAISYHPPIDRLDNKALVAQFQMFCEIVAAAGPCMFIAEELSFTTQAGHAPRAWRNLITVYSRDRGIIVIGTTQRPALVDKTFMSNCTELSVSALNFPDDQDVMRRALNVPLQDVAALDLKQWITRDRKRREVRSETLETGRPKVKKQKKPAESAGKFP